MVRIQDTLLRVYKQVRLIFNPLLILVKGKVLMGKVEELIHDLCLKSESEIVCVSKSYELSSSIGLLVTLSLPFNYQYKLITSFINYQRETLLQCNNALDSIKVP